jgi:hypothetical protein
MARQKYLLAIYFNSENIKKTICLIKIIGNINLSKNYSKGCTLTK